MARKIQSRSILCRLRFAFAVNALRIVNDQMHSLEIVHV